MGPIWGPQDPGGPHVGPMNCAIWVILMCKVAATALWMPAKSQRQPVVMHANAQVTHSSESTVAVATFEHSKHFFFFFIFTTALQGHAAFSLKSISCIIFWNQITPLQMSLWYYKGNHRYTIQLGQHFGKHICWYFFIPILLKKKNVMMFDHQMVKILRLCVAYFLYIMHLSFYCNFCIYNLTIKCW